MKELFFNTVNESKKKEIEFIFKDCLVKKFFFGHPVQEILSEELKNVILQKAADAYKRCNVPIIVEHGALQIDYLKSLPGALSKPFRCV